VIKFGTKMSGWQKCKPGHCNATRQSCIFLSPCRTSGGKKPRGFGLVFPRWSDKLAFGSDILTRPPNEVQRVPNRSRVNALCNSHPTRLFSCWLVQSFRKTISCTKYTLRKCCSHFFKCFCFDIFRSMLL
jgi:hypothetical protein